MFLSLCLSRLRCAGSLKFIPLVRHVVRSPTLFENDCPQHSLRKFSTSFPAHCSKAENGTEEKDRSPDSQTKQELTTLPTKMFLAYTCEVCKVRNQKTISKQAYTKGVVIVKCDGCANNHLIADNLGWFTDTKKQWNIEDIMALKGETVRKISDEAHAWEIVEETVTQMKISEEK